MNSIDFEFRGMYVYHLVEIGLLKSVMKTNKIPPDPQCLLLFLWDRVTFPSGLPFPFRLQAKEGKKKLTLVDILTFFLNLDPKLILCMPSSCSGFCRPCGVRSPSRRHQRCRRHPLKLWPASSLFSFVDTFQDEVQLQRELLQEEEPQAAFWGSFPHPEEADVLPP